MRDKMDDARPHGPNMAAVLHGVGDLRVEEIGMPVPGAGELLIAVRSVGICGSDVHYLTHGRIGDFVCRGPMVLGHEASGVVAAVGPGVPPGLWSVGDRVALEPGVPCGRCELCRTGRYNLCAEVRFAATPPVDGSLARYVTHPAAFCYRLPTSMSFDTAALLEPLSVGIHACRRAGVGVGDRVLITGAGTVGLLCMVAARAAGAGRIVVTDVDAGRLAMARTLAGGADETVLIEQSAADNKKSNDNVVVKEGGGMGNGEDKEKLTTGGGGGGGGGPDGGERTGVQNMQEQKHHLHGVEWADACIECSGAESGVRLCMERAKRGGTVVLVGMGKAEMQVPLLDAACREVDVRGVFRYCNTYPTALELASRVDLSPLVTHRFPLMESRQAFDTFLSRSSKSIKIIIDCSAAS